MLWGPGYASPSQIISDTNAFDFSEYFIPKTFVTSAQKIKENCGFGHIY